MDVLTAVRTLRAQAIADGQAPAADDEWWSRQHPDAVYMDPTSKRALDALGCRINPGSRRPWTYDIAAWSAIRGTPSEREEKKEALIAKIEAERKSLAQPAADRCWSVYLFCFTLHFRKARGHVPLDTRSRNCCCVILFAQVLVSRRSLCSTNCAILTRSLNF